MGGKGREVGEREIAIRRYCLQKIYIFNKSKGNLKLQILTVIFLKIGLSHLTTVMNYYAGTGGRARGAHILRVQGTRLAC